MFTPRAFRVDDTGKLVAFMRRYSFCTLLTAGSEPLVSHVPVLVDDDDGGVFLTGHLARANPHLKKLPGHRCTAIFHGPHSYVSPAWYADPAEVPTWNYAVVHASGPARVLDHPRDVGALVDRMVDHYEALYGKPWNRELDETYRSRQLEHIAGFRIAVDELTGKYKLGQNRSHEDQDGMVRGLESSGIEDSLSLAAFIRRNRDDG